MREKRTDKRRHSFYYLNLIDCENIRNNGQLIDISDGGLKMISKAMPETNSVRKFRLMLPETTFGKDWVEFEARTKWCAIDVNPDYYASGVEFENIEDEDTIILRRALENCLFDN